MLESKASFKEEFLISQQTLPCYVLNTREMHQTVWDICLATIRSPQELLEDLSSARMICEPVALMLFL